MAYASVDHLLLAGLGWEALSEGQREAIRQWVGLGGHLVFTGGASAARTLGQMPRALRPASVLSTRGVAPNELTDSHARDSFAGTPWHKFVPARLQKVSRDATSAV